MKKVVIEKLRKRKCVEEDKKLSPLSVGFPFVNDVSSFALLGVRTVVVNMLLRSVDSFLGSCVLIFVAGKYLATVRTFYFVSHVITYRLQVLYGFWLMVYMQKNIDNNKGKERLTLYTFSFSPEHAGFCQNIYRLDFVL